MDVILPYLETVGPYLPYVMGASGFLLALFVVVTVARRGKNHTPAKNAVMQAKPDPIAVAQHEADRIVADARQQAHQIVANTQAFKQEIDTDAKHTMEEAVQHDSKGMSEEVAALDAKYKEFLDRLQSEYFQSVEKSLQEGRLSVEKYLKQKIDDEFARAKRQIEQFKQMQIKKIEDLTVPTVTRISKEVLGKSFSPQEHEEIIASSLEKAKREGLFEF